MIKNIIFDLGGVVLNIDYQKTSNEFVKLGLKDFDNLYSQAKQSSLFDDFEMGIITDEKFREGIRKITGMIFCDMELDCAWNAMLLDLPSERISLLERAKKNYRTFLLSNTNSIHYEDYTRRLQIEHGLKSLGDLFEKEYYSHLIQLRKPNIEAFNFVIKDSEINPSETLFIDDSPQHIEGAKKAGLKTFFMDKSKGLTLADIINTNGTLKETVLNNFA